MREREKRRFSFTFIVIEYIVSFLREKEDDRIHGAKKVLFHAQDLGALGSFITFFYT
jgi:hypothetical protein